MVKFLQAGKKGEISNFIRWFCLRDKFLEKISETHQFPVLTMKGCEKFHQNLNRGFRFSLPKNCKISLSRREGQNLKFHRFVLFKKIQFWEDWIGNQEAVFSQTFHAPSVSEHKTAMSISFSSNLFFSQNQPMKFEIWPFLPGSIKLAQFFLGWIGNRSQFFPKLFIALQCHNTKLLNQCTFNTKQFHKIWNFHLLACLGDFFSGLNWKPGVSTFYHSFWLNQFTFKRIPSDRPWKVWAKSELWFPIQPTQK